jgi:phosphoribosyl-AMP cyclohydrolase
VTTQTNDTQIKFAERGTSKDIETSNLFCPKFDENGLIPCVVSENKTGTTLMLAYMNANALSLTIETGKAHFWSRSRDELWQKGAISGHNQRIVEILTDCDQDAICLIVEQEGAACHVGFHSCFYRSVTTGKIASSTNIPLVQRNMKKTFNPSEIYGGKT